MRIEIHLHIFIYVYTYLLIHALPDFVFRILERDPSPFAKVVGTSYIIEFDKGTSAIWDTSILCAVLCSILLLQAASGKVLVYVVVVVAAAAASATIVANCQQQRQQEAVAQG